MRKEIQNKDLHLFASNLIENKINFNHQPNDNPKGNIKDFPRYNFSLNVPEWKRYAECTKIIFSRIVLESCKYLGKVWNYFSFYNVTEGPVSNENMWGTYQQTYPIVIGGWLVRTV